MGNVEPPASASGEGALPGRVSTASGRGDNHRIEALYRRYRRNRARNERKADHLYGASQYQLMLAKFRKHRVAMVSLVLLVLFYLVALGAEFVAPYDKALRFEDRIYASPSRVHITDAQGRLAFPFIYSTMSTVNPDTFKYEVVEDRSRPYPIRLFIEAAPYKIAGIIPANRHLFGVVGDEPLLLLGADHLGRDLFSRIVYASRVSLFVGFGGVIVSFCLGILLGGISGYFGGVVDLSIQRTIELLICIPQIPLWMALSAAIPEQWTGIQTYFAITLILSLVGWTGLARVVRGKILSLREEEYVTAAVVSSAGPLAIIFRHLLPGFTSYLIVDITIAIPYMILGETTLSFLGLGILPPDVSWGSLLQQAQDVTVIANYPWLLLPAAFVISAVILFNFVGDGLRDAADPYAR